MSVTVTEGPRQEVRVYQEAGDPVVVLLDPGPSVVKVVERGPAGEKGDPGDTAEGSGDLFYEHQQHEPTTSKVIVHGLGKYPSVGVKDSAGTTVEMDVEYLDLNTVRLESAYPFSYTAFFN